MDAYSGRFLGDPGFEIPLTAADVPEKTEEAVPGEEAAPKPTLTEEKKLAAVIKQIDYDVHIVPRGAYYKDSLHNISINNLNQGVV